jgi:peptide alpha-N-acetyltransferase
MALTFRQYERESDIDAMIPLFESTLSEPYTIWSYRFFVEKHSQLSHLAFSGARVVGCILARVDDSPDAPIPSVYVGMVCTHEDFRHRGIATRLLHRTIAATRALGIRRLVLETETHNHAALSFYSAAGFRRTERLHGYYLSGTSAYRLVADLPDTEANTAV